MVTISPVPNSCRQLLETLRLSALERVRGHEPEQEKNAERDHDLLAAEADRGAEADSEDADELDSQQAEPRERDAGGSRNLSWHTQAAVQAARRSRVASFQVALQRRHWLQSTAHTR